MSNNRSLSEFFNSVVKSMRIWQWPKNLIVFTIPLGIAATDFKIYANIKSETTHHGNFGWKGKFGDSLEIKKDPQ